MEQTALDLWLRRKLLYVTHVYCNTLPDRLPKGCALVEDPEETDGRFRYRFSTRSPAELDRLIESLRERKITFTSRIKDRETWYAGLFNNPDRSFTCRVAWIAILGAVLLLIFSGLPQRVWNQLTEEPPEMETVPDR